MKDIEKVFDDIHHGILVEVDKLTTNLERSRATTMQAVVERNDQEVKRLNNTFADVQRVHETIQSSMAELEKHLLPVVTVVDKHQCVTRLSNDADLLAKCEYVIIEKQKSHLLTADVNTWKAYMNNWSQSIITTLAICTPQLTLLQLPSIALSLTTKTNNASKLQSAKAASKQSQILKTVGASNNGT